VPAVEWAAVILVNQSGELLLNLRDLTKKVAPGVWDLVGGTLEPGETPAECALREVREETGYQLEEVSWFGAFDLPIDPQNCGRLHVYASRLDIPASQLVIGEGIEHRFFDTAQLTGLGMAAGLLPILHDFLRSEHYGPAVA
jgi:8-oxo-dGTP diphosphatase